MTAVDTKIGMAFGAVIGCWIGQCIHVSETAPPKAHPGLLSPARYSRTSTEDRLARSDNGANRPLGARGTKDSRQRPTRRLGEHLGDVDQAGIQSRSPGVPVLRRPDTGRQLHRAEPAGSHWGGTGVTPARQYRRTLGSKCRSVGRDAAEGYEIHDGGDRISVL